MKLHDTGGIKSALNDLDFPAAKEQIVEHARRRGVGRDADQALSALPRGEYASLREVLRSVPLDPAPGRSETERTAQRRRAKPGLAEHERPARPSPIEDELRRRP
ncbi:MULTISPECIES: DUF2795 domain-containing protein [Thermomonospora]|uniref:DUF2795 domain-containing protein n=1 Tax=Thermomonospora curvata (strain ATCC 19995 / DSM 43183 / JCM 3096 / KCTC 9072 / NBRC 15933 / NCIMB 10081 / Henssen B9) TaxID=471852 RepID=D1ADW0_THECD|nr:MULTISPECIES: DUF2795 domain-containing protein [Thermomonospora]ACY97570.1 hypothetical protein Tcur_2003 [Thermomonospora curvata DSM 43183]PKK14517.1 MAG: DUF2795 domain-containing protein [Thermomonospora sp. CIF 1]